MMSADSNLFLIVLGVVAIIAEIILGAITGFELLIIGIILIISGGVGMLTGSLTIALITFVVLTVVYIFVGRNHIKNRFLAGKTNKTNVDALIGAKGLVVSPIEPQKAGQVKINDEVWRAESEKAHAKDETVTVTAVSGVTIYVS